MEGYQKVAAFLEASGLLEGKVSLSIDVRTCDPTVCIIYHIHKLLFSNYMQSICMYSAVCTVCYLYSMTFKTNTSKTNFCLTQTNFWALFGLL